MNSVQTVTHKQCTKSQYTSPMLQYNEPTAHLLQYNLTPCNTISQPPCTPIAIQFNTLHSLYCNTPWCPTIQFLSSAAAPLQYTSLYCNTIFQPLCPPQLQYNFSLLQYTSQQAFSCNTILSQTAPYCNTISTHQAISQYNLGSSPNQLCTIYFFFFFFFISSNHWKIPKNIYIPFFFIFQNTQINL